MFPELDYHLDHIDPLSRGGAHRAENLQLLPGFLNLSKRAMSHEEALAGVEGYREWVEAPPYFESHETRS